jgi:hypothetical protein
MSEVHRVQNNPATRRGICPEIRRATISPLVLVADDEPDVEVLFRQRFRRDWRDLRAGQFTMEFAQSGPAALQRIRDTAGVSLILILSDINIPGMSGLEPLPKPATGCTGDHDHRLDYRDYLGAWQRFRAEHPCEVELLAMSSYLIDYPFAGRLFLGGARRRQAKRRRQELSHYQ